MFKTFLDRLYYSYEMLAYHIPFFAAAYIRFHAPSVNKELSLLHIKSTDRVLHIGCGAIPYTSFFIAQETGAHVTGIDHKPPIVKNAVHVLHRYSQSNNISITRGEGTTYDVSSFDIIIVSYGIAGQERIVRHVLSSSKPGTRVLVRTSTAKQNASLIGLIRPLIVNRARLLLTQESLLFVVPKTT